MALTCPNCGNDRNFLVKTLQMHVVQVRDDARVEANEEGRPAVIELSRNRYTADTLPRCDVARLSVGGGWRVAPLPYRVGAVSATALVAGVRCA